MKRIALIAAALVALSPFVAEAGPKGSQTGHFVSAADTVWFGEAVWDVWLDPDPHVKDTANFEVDDVVIRVVCKQDTEAGYRGVADFAIPVVSSGLHYETLMQSPSLPDLDPALPGWCDSYLLHTTIKGKNHTIEVLDQITFAVNPVSG